MNIRKVFGFFSEEKAVVEPTVQEELHPILGLTKQEIEELKGMYISNIKKGIAATGDTPADAEARALVSSSVDALRAMHANEQAQPPDDPKYPTPAGFDLRKR